MANLNVSYEQLESEAAALRQAKDELGAQFDELRARIEAMVTSGFVTDRSSGALGEAYNEFRSGAVQTIMGLDQIILYLIRLSTTLQQADTQLSQQLGE